MPWPPTMAATQARIGIGGGQARQGSELALAFGAASVSQEGATEPHVGIDRAFVGGKSPALPDFAAYPQFALYWSMEFRGGTDILERPALMEWLARMRPYVNGNPPHVPPQVGLRPLP